MPAVPYRGPAGNFYWYDIVLEQQNRPNISCANFKTSLLTLMSHFGTNHIVHKNLTFYFLSRSIFIIVLGQKRGSKPVRFSSSPHHTSEGREDIFFLCSQNRARKKPGNRMVSGFFRAISFLVAQCGCGDRTRTCDLRVMSPTSYQLLYSAIWNQNGAGDRTRTGTASLPGDFKSPVSTIPPHRQLFGNE